MDDAAAPCLNGPHAALWRRLCAWHPDEASAAFAFSARLARDNGWTPAFAARAIGEYRRFVFLAMTAGHMVTPSDTVDQVWHLHLCDTRAYWETFCPHVLGAALHHHPSPGGAAERARHFEQYAQTLRAYEAAFGTLAPPAIWPEARQALVRDPAARRVHLHRCLILPRRWAVPGAALAGLALALGGFTLGRGSL